jgi:hypothetical protein
VRALAIWLAAVILFSIAMGIWMANGVELEVFVAFMVWLAGLAVLAVIGVLVLVGALLKSQLQRRGNSAQESHEDGTPEELGRLPRDQA